MGAGELCEDAFAADLDRRRSSQPRCPFLQHPPWNQRQYPAHRSGKIDMERSFDIDDADIPGIEKCRSLALDDPALARFLPAHQIAALARAQDMAAIAHDPVRPGSKTRHFRR